MDNRICECNFITALNGVTFLVLQKIFISFETHSLLLSPVVSNVAVKIDLRPLFYLVKYRSSISGDILNHFVSVTFIFWLSLVTISGGSRFENLMSLM